MTKRLLPFLLAAALAFSGCLGLFGDDDVETDDGLDDGNGDDLDENDGNGDENGDDGSNGNDNTTDDAAPPTASLSANTTSGEGPLNVTFTIEGTGAAGAELTWTLDLGDGSSGASGDSLPATVTHSYEPGNHTATLTVTDGEQSDQAQVTISVTEPAETAEPNPVQTGTNGLCLDYNVLYNVDGVMSPLGPTVDVEAGTDYVTTSSEGVVYVDFFTADEVSIDWGPGTGTVPEGAAFGVICVAVQEGYPGVPYPLAEWTYQDGF